VTLRTRLTSAVLGLVLLLSLSIGAVSASTTVSASPNAALCDALVTAVNRLSMVDTLATRAIIAVLERTEDQVCVA
jgi:hypothetical protein